MKPPLIRRPPQAFRKHMMKTLHAQRWSGLAGLTGLGALLCAATSPAQAQDDGYYYGGVSLGQSRARIDEERITASLLGAGLATTAMDRDNRSAAYKLFGGYQFNRHVAIEAGYFDLGKFGFRSTTDPAGTLQGQIKLRGLNLDLVGTWPLTPRLSVIGRVGAQHAQARDSFSGSGAVNVLTPSPRETATNAKFGAGLQYAITPSLLVRAEAERYRVNDAVGNRGDVNMVSVSLVMPFGRTAAPARVAAAAPLPAPWPAAQPVAQARPAPEPQPVATVSPAPAPEPARRRVNFSADSMFAFDQATVGAEGRRALDRLVAELEGTQFDVVSVDGHTDRIGSQAYNQALSTQRAEAVKTYLVTSGRLDPNKVVAAGKGESAPITKAQDCQGDRPSPKLIACLQPDRRVEVEVSGSKR
jgi:OOP family OmpA-OmpF porin